MCQVSLLLEMGQESTPGTEEHIFMNSTDDTQMMGRGDSLNSPWYLL